MNKIHYLHSLDALDSVHFEVRFGRTEPNLLQKNEKIIESLNAVGRDELAFNSVSIRFGKSLKSQVSLYFAIIFSILLEIKERFNVFILFYALNNSDMYIFTNKYATVIEMA